MLLEQEAGEGSTDDVARETDKSCTTEASYARRRHAIHSLVFFLVMLYIALKQSNPVCFRQILTDSEEVGFKGIKTGSRKSN